MKPNLDSKMAALVAAMILAAEAMAKEQQSEEPAQPKRVMVISIAGGKLALIEDGRPESRSSTDSGLELRERLRSS